jgi:hypothetical protein
LAAFFFFVYGRRKTAKRIETETGHVGTTTSAVPAGEARR